MRSRLAAVGFFLLLAASAAAAGATPSPCGTPTPADDGWLVERDPALAGFAPEPLCDAMRAFADSPRNLHALVVARHGRLVAEAYRDGRDRSTYLPWARQTAFDKDALEQVIAATVEQDRRREPQRSGSAAEEPRPAAVETRATVRSITREESGQRVYVHLKVVPGAKLPFTTLRFRVRDAALLAGVQEGASVKFRAERIEGENTLTAIRVVPPCVRFQPCD